MSSGLCAFAACLAISLTSPGAERPPSLMTIQAAGAKLRPLMRGKAPPDPDAEPKKTTEPGQTFAEYVASNPNRPNRIRPTFYLQVIGDLKPKEEQMAREIEELLNVAFGTSIKRAEAVRSSSIPKQVFFERRGWGSSGFLATSLLENIVAPRRPNDAVSVLALTGEDLWKGEGLKIVFGRASFERHVGAMSFARIGDPESDWNAVLERALKVAVHETAHTLGVFHCLAFECGMNETNSLSDVDHRPLEFCSECEMKMWWACGLDPVARTQGLLDYCEARQLTAAAAEYRRRLQVLQMRR